MKIWIKALLCVAAAAALVACSDDDTPAATATTTTTTGGTVSAAALTSVSTGMESAAGFAIDGVSAGVYGDFTFFPPAAFTGLESPAAAGLAVPCSSGTAVYAGGSKTITYTNCKVTGSDGTLNGVVKVVGSGTGGSAVYTVTFDIDAAHPLTITGAGADNKTATFTYSGTEVVSNLNGAYPEYTSGKIVLNATVKVGTSSTFKFTNFTVTYAPNGGTLQRITVEGKYATTIKLSDFGVPAIAGVPDTVDMEFAVTTPTPVDINYTTGVEAAGVLRFAGTGFTIEIDYGAKKARFTATGAATQEFPL